MPFMPPLMPSRVLPWPRSTRTRPIVPVFLPFRGCPVRCIFCAQDVQTGLGGQSGGPTSSLARILGGAGERLRARAAHALPLAELAFYGGTFTAMPGKDQEACLEFAAEMLAQGLICAFRCSTRPDCVDARALARLRAAGCETVELGVQSFADAALAASRRGYGGATAVEACSRIKVAGLRLGVQLLPGMPGVSPAIFLADVARALEIGADMLRFYPCLVLEGTELARLWRDGGYRPWSLETTLEALACGWLAARAAGRPVIRMGLAPEPGPGPRRVGRTCGPGPGRTGHGPGNAGGCPRCGRRQASVPSGSAARLPGLSLGGQGRAARGLGRAGP